MLKILFICHGNICRSTMCEFVMKHLVNEADLEEYFEISSAATSREEIGNDTYSPAKEKLREEGIPFTPRKARQVTKADYDYYDLLICADDANVRNTSHITGGDPDHKIKKLLEYVGSDRSIADPWYTRNFDETYDDVSQGCEALLLSLIDNIRPTHFKVFKNMPGVTGYFTFRNAVVKGSPYDNYEFIKEIGLDQAKLVQLKQVHESTIGIIKESTDKVIYLDSTDGSITNKKNVLLTTVHADCLPVYFYDDVNEAIGLVHSGWRGTNLGIAPKCLKMMMDEYGTDPAKVHVFVGPGISQCCFEVGPEVLETFTANWPFANVYAIPKGEKYFLDLKGIVKNQLTNMNVPSSNIEISNHCTYHEPELFRSYRREGKDYMSMGAGLCLKEN